MDRPQKQHPVSGRRGKRRFMRKSNQGNDASTGNKKGLGLKEITARRGGNQNLSPAKAEVKR